MPDEKELAQIFERLTRKQAGVQTETYRLAQAVLDLCVKIESLEKRFEEHEGLAPSSAHASEESEKLELAVTEAEGDKE